MKIDELTIGDAKAIARLLGGNNTEQHPAVGRYCVVRTFAAGVHAGTIESVNGSDVRLKNSRRIWKWQNAFTLSEVAIKGIAIEGSRIACVVPDLFLSSMIEIIPCSPESQKAIEAGHE